MVGINVEASTGQDWPRLFGDGEDVESGRFSETVGHGEDLERPAEVQHFHFIEDQDGKVAAHVSNCSINQHLHGLLMFF